MTLHVFIFLIIYIFSACGGTFSLPQGTIQSPSYPNNYPHNRQCTYLIRQPEGAQITLIFNAFRLEESLCNYDYVEVCIFKKILFIFFLRIVNTLFFPHAQLNDKYCYSVKIIF